MGGGAPVYPAWMRAAIYVRISDDRSGESESPERQENICRTLAESRGWEIVQVYSDLDLSAFKAGVVRPAYNSMLEAVERGDVEAVLVWSLTRLARTVREFSRVMDFLAEHGCALASARDPVDTSTATGRAMMQLHGVFAELESANISSRVRDAQAHARAQGRMWTGGSRAFGWRAGVQVPEEAEVLQEIAARLLAGESRETVARDLNEREIPTGGGGLWWGSTVWQCVTAPIHAGYRVHDGEVFEGTWEPILDRETHRRLLALSGRRAPRGGVKLLSGLLRCGICFETMHHSKAGSRYFVYRCRKAAGWRGCGKVSISAPGIEEHVYTSVLDFIARSAIRPLGVVADGRLAALSDEIAGDETALADLAQDRYVHRTITAAEFESVRATLAERLAGNAERLAAGRLAMAEAQEALPPGDRDALEAWWTAADMPERRLALQRAVQNVVIHPVGKRGSAWRPDERIEIHWDWRIYLDAASASTATPEEAEAAYEALRSEEPGAG